MAKAEKLGITEFPYSESDKRGNEIYCENIEGFWWCAEHDDRNNILFIENSWGEWEYQEFDVNNAKIYYEHSDGRWEKMVYDIQHYILIKYEDYQGNYWTKGMSNKCPYLAENLTI